MSLFQGSFVALITPFDAKGRVDEEVLAKLVAWHIAQGTDGIVCCGTTGEAPVLTETEKKLVARTCIAVAQKKIPIIVGTGLAGTQDTISLTEEMQKLGADGCLVVTPYYNKPSQRGCLIHFQEIAKVGLPMIVYNNPGRSVVSLSVETTIEISQIPGVVAIKESIRDIEVIQKVRKVCSLPIFSGEDDFTLEILQEGGVGAISVIANVIPKEWKQMIQFAREGNWEKAKRLSNRNLSLCKALFYETNPQGVKFLMAWLSLCKSGLRLPLLEPKEATQRELKKALLAIALPHLQRQTLPSLDKI
jgi:4-hydroxy-tetrahydrodipicolinate synthase